MFTQIAVSITLFNGEPAKVAHDGLTSQRRLLAIVEASPGLSMGELIGRCGLSAGTVHYHLARLESTGEITTISMGRRRIVFAASDIQSWGDAAHGRAILRGSTAFSVAAAIVERPHRSVIDLVIELRQSPRAVYYHLRRLRAAGLVLSTSAVRYRNLTPAHHLPGLLKEVKEGGLIADDLPVPKPPDARTATGEPLPSPISQIFG